eukprot:scaffold71413_cov29-Attheya_sp.AAC.1
MKVEDADKPQKMSQSNPKSIHFIPQTLTEKTKFSNLLTRELLLRELPAMDDITLRRERLQDALRRERFLRRLQKQIEHGTVDDSALFLVMQKEDTMCSRNVAAEEDRLAIRCRTPGELSEFPMVADDDAHTAM